MNLSPPSSYSITRCVISAPIAAWLDLLWEAVCLRAARPIAGILLDSKAISEVAEATFEEFLTKGGNPEATLQGMLSVLTKPVQEQALSYVAQHRNDDPQKFRDLSKARWEKNPALPDLLLRDNEGQLISDGWQLAEPVLWQRAIPILRKLGINENDSRDVYSEIMADFLKARPGEQCPMRKMRVFEELPRLFGVIAERRAISWLRKQTTLKMQPNRGGLSLDDPDSGLSSRLPEPRSLPDEDPMANLTFDHIRASCPDALNHFEWHLVEAIFVEGNRTRDELITEDWVLEQLEVDPSSSRSTKLRRLNMTIADALSSLGKALGEADLLASSDIS